MKRLLSVLILGLSLVFTSPVHARGAVVSARPAVTVRAPVAAPRPAAPPRVTKTPAPKTTPVSSAAPAAASSSSSMLSWLPAWMLFTSASAGADDCKKEKKECR